MRGSYLGPSFTNTEIAQFLKENDAPYVRLSDAELFPRVAEELAAGPK